MSDMTPQEQLMLELINRARMDPNGEAKRFGIKLNEGVSKGDKISADAKQVLAGNDDLLQAANAHSSWVLDKDKFSHDEGSKDPRDRMDDAGYDFDGNWTWGENIAYSSQAGAISDAQATRFIIQQHKQLFVDKGVDGRGHRTNILESDFQEIGIGQVIGKFKSDGRNLDTSMVTQDFARAGNNAFVNGVVYDDNDDDDFFSVGEETVDSSITTGGGPTDQTGLGGGYELLFAAGAGAQTVSFNLTGGTVTVDLTLGSRNVKVDVVNGTEVWTDSSITATSTNVTEIHALGIRAVNFDGADSAQAMYGNNGANIIEGNAGADTLVGGRGRDELHGGTNNDTFVFDNGDTGKTNTKADTIVDFTQLQDLINLNPWDADSKKNDQDFEFIGTQKFHKDAGELRFFQDGGDTFIQGDTNGDGKADLVIRLNGIVNLASSDFDL